MKKFMLLVAVVVMLLAGVSTAYAEVVEIRGPVQQITEDTREYFGFKCEGISFKFPKLGGTESWIETVKYSYRNEKDVICKYDDNITDAQGNRIPTDIHDG